MVISKTQIMMDKIDEELKWALFSDKSFQEVVEEVMQSLNDTYKRDIKKEIMNIAKINLEKDEGKVVEMLADSWKNDSVTLGKTYRRDLLVSKMKGERLTKEDAIRLCYYLKIPFENSKSYKENELYEYKERFNNVQAFIRNLLLQDELSYRIFQDIFWLLDLSKPINEREGYLSVKLCLEKIEQELEEKIESINDFEEFVDFVFKEEGVYRIYICFAEGGKRIGRYYNKIDDFLSKKFGGDYEPDSNEKKRRIYECLVAICNRKSLEEDEDEKRWEYQLEDMKSQRNVEVKRRKNISLEETRVLNDWFELVSSSMRKTITLSLKEMGNMENDQKRLTEFISQRIRKKKWECINDIYQEIVSSNNEILKDMRGLAKYSISLKSIVRKRLNALGEFEPELKPIQGVYITESFLSGEEKKIGENKLFEGFLERLKLDYQEGTYMSRISAKGQRELFILVTLLLRYRQNEYEFMNKDVNEASYYYEYMNKELERIGLRGLDVLNYFDAIITMIIWSENIGEYLEPSKASTFKKYKELQLEDRKKL